MSWYIFLGFITATCFIFVLQVYLWALTKELLLFQDGAARHVLPGPPLYIFVIIYLLVNCS